MLTREQLHTECRKIFDALPDRGETIDGVDDAVLKLNKQAAMAIKLQSKLDKVREWADNLISIDEPIIDEWIPCLEWVHGKLLSVVDEKGE